MIKDYNEVYFKPSKAKLDELYAKGLLSKDALFKAPLWVEFYELWHHEGRRARMGAAMMAPDYSWWHGFYECKKRFVKFHQEADESDQGAQEGLRGALLPRSHGQHHQAAPGLRAQEVAPGTLAQIPALPAQGGDCILEC